MRKISASQVAWMVVLAALVVMAPAIAYVAGPLAGLFAFGAMYAATAQFAAVMPESVNGVSLALGRFRMTKGLMTLIVGGIVWAVGFPIVETQVTGTDTTGWGTGLGVLYAVLFPVILLIGGVLHLVGYV